MFMFDQILYIILYSRNQGDEYITLQMDSSEVKNSFDNSEYTGLKALEGIVALRCFCQMF
jgi:hypothetical protein